MDHGLVLDDGEQPHAGGQHAHPQQDQRRQALGSGNAGTSDVPIRNYTQPDSGRSLSSGVLMHSMTLGLIAGAVDAA